VPHINPRRIAGTDDDDGAQLEQSFRPRPKVLCPTHPRKLAIFRSFALLTFQTLELIVLPA